MRKLYLVFLVLLMNISNVNAFTWDNCIERYKKAKQFSNNIRLSYNYLKSTKNCLIKFKNILIENPDPEFTVKAMNENILMLDKYIIELLPKYSFPNNTLNEIPKVLFNYSSTPIYNKEYNYFKKFKNCNGVHANNKIYTAKHCKVKNSKSLHYDLNYIDTNKTSELEISKLDINKKGTYKYYSMSKEGMFYNTLLEEKNCKFYKAKNELVAISKTLDLTDLTKEYEIRSTCLAIPSNSGGGVFQNGKLVGIISKTVFDKNKFLYSIIEPIIQDKNIIEKEDY